MYIIDKEEKLRPLALVSHVTMVNVVFGTVLGAIVFWLNIVRVGDRLRTVTRLYNCGLVLFHTVRVIQDRDREGRRGITTI